VTHPSGDLRIACPGIQVMTVLQLTGLDLHAYRTVEECFELAISDASVRCMISSEGTPTLLRPRAAVLNSTRGAEGHRGESATF